MGQRIQIEKLEEFKSTSISCSIFIQFVGQIFSREGRGGCAGRGFESLEGPWRRALFALNGGLPHKSLADSHGTVSRKGFSGGEMRASVSPMAGQKMGGPFTRI